MKKSKKLTVIYIISSILLFATLLFGGAYGIYLSVGVSFMRSTVSPITEISDVGDYDNPIPLTNTSYGGSFNFQSSMIGVIVLSVVLIVLSIVYLVSLFKQLIFFKQFKLIRESGLEHLMEKQVKSKSSVVFIAGTINIISILVGIAGIFINATSNFIGGQIWILYVIDGLVVVFSLVSFILLIKKVKENKKYREELENKYNHNNKNESKEIHRKDNLKENLLIEVDGGFNEVDKIEYILLKLKNLKESKIISNDEYDYFREKFTGFSNSKTNKIKSKKKVVK